jgi:predicted DNA-binding protein
LTITFLYAIILLNGGDNMAIGKDKTGVLVNMSRETKAKLEELAKKDGRSMTNLINKILSDYLKDK